MKKKIGFIFGFVLCLIVLGADRVGAEELRKDACLYVGSQKMVYSGEIVNTERRDDSGRGSAVYDPNTNTLTVTNCHIENKAPVITFQLMGDDFTIVFRGVNEFKTGYWAASIKTTYEGTALHIKGDGVLYANEGILFSGKGDKDLEIEGVTLHFTSSHYGISATTGDVKIKNAVIDVAITTKENPHPLTCGIRAVSLEVEDSNITTKVPEAGIMTIAGPYFPQAVVADQSGGIKLSPDMTVTNAEGKPLYRQAYHAGTSVGDILAYTVYQDGADAGNLYKMSNTVNITSQAKTKELADTAKVDEVIRLIGEIGTVTGQSGNAIERARKAYNALNEGLREKVTNYGALLEAESTYSRLCTANVAIKSVKSKKAQQAAVRWKKLDGCDGYEVAYGRKNKLKNGKLKSAKVKIVKKGKTTGVTLKNLRSGTSYYVQIRAYKTVNGHTIYGAWSKPKKVKVK